MALTYHDLIERLKQEEETDLIEALDLRSADIVGAFSDLIEARRAYLVSQFGYEDEEYGAEEENE